MMKGFRSLMLLALAGCAFGGSAGAFAQGNAKAGQNDASQLMQSYQQKTQQLESIQQKAIKNTPKLATEMKQFQTEVNASMRAHGYDLAKGRQRVNAMVAKLKSGKKVSTAERTSTMKSFQAEREKMMKARVAAMHDPKIQKDGQALQHDVIAAMEKQDSHTTQLLKDTQSLRAKIMASVAAQRAAAKKGAKKS